MEESWRDAGFVKADFGDDFKWGVSTAAYQIEGAYNVDGKGLSIWDEFSNRKGKIKNNHNGNIACDFYNRYEEDVSLLQKLHIPNFRFSLSWPRIIPQGSGSINPKGIDYYNRLIDACLEKNITPWITLYHWDLPLELSQKGGWTNRDIVNWFTDYTEICVKNFGDRVKNWMVLNEPMAFTGAGYFLGLHAPGKRGMNSFLAAVHHAVLCQAEAGRVIKSILPNAQVGNTFSFSHIDSYSQKPKDILAAERVDTLLNHLFADPYMGLGYPVAKLKFLNRMERFVKPGDEEKMAFDADFIGIQNYTREIVKYSFFTPVIQANLISAKKRNVPHTAMNWEIYPESIYNVLKKVSRYSKAKNIIVTENGAAFPDIIQDGKIHDEQRLEYIQNHLKQVLRAKQEGVNVNGYFIWSFLDNFEWAEGYTPRFGIVHVDYETQKRTPKKSALWYKYFLGGS
ncbi:MAG: beta-glucosidase [Sphingobacteriales bacterium]|nr:MAG: beta-glucosidase [Sphingobacteriales bacterium]